MSGSPSDQVSERHQRRPGARVPDVVAAVTAVAADLRSSLDTEVTVLDLGGGTGGVAVPLAAQGCDVTVVDPSPDALAALARRAREAGIADRVRGVQGDGDSLAETVGTDRFDLVCCHGTLEHVDDPAATLSAIAAVLRPGGVLSLVVAGRLAVVLAKAVAGEFGAATAVLEGAEGRWGSTDPLPRRFDLHQVQELLQDAGLVVDRTTGIGVLRHLVPEAFLDSDEDHAALARLEDLLVATPEREVLRTLGSSLHVLAHRS